MASIVLHPGWRLISDSRQWILQKLPEDTEKEYWQPRGYYRSIEAALEDYTQHRLRYSDATTIVDLLTLVKHIRKELALLTTIHQE